MSRPECAHGYKVGKDRSFSGSDELTRHVQECPGPDEPAFVAHPGEPPYTGWIVCCAGCRQVVLP